MAERIESWGHLPDRAGRCQAPSHALHELGRGLRKPHHHLLKRRLHAIVSAHLLMPCLPRSYRAGCHSQAARSLRGHDCAMMLTPPPMTAYAVSVFQNTRWAVTSTELRFVPHQPLLTTKQARLQVTRLAFDMRTSSESRMASAEVSCTPPVKAQTAPRESPRPTCTRLISFTACWIAS